MRPHLRPRHIGVALLGSLALLVAQSSPAAAHTISGPRPTNYRTRVLTISPHVPGLSVRVVDLGNHLELVNHTSSDVLVLGYGGEPYLRVGPRGVFRNKNSAATYLDRTRYGTTAVPAFATTENAETHPDWQRISGGDTVRWHDHRIHWMSTVPPPQVQIDPDAVHRLGAPWHVELTYRDQRIVATGQLDWVPGPSGKPWLLLIGVSLVVGVGATIRRRTFATLAVVVAALVAIDAFHAVAAEMFRPGTTVARTVQFVGDDFVSIIVWISAIPTIAALRRRAPEAVYGTLFVAAMIALVGGATDLSYLWKSQLPTAGPDVLQRGAVCLLVGLGAGTAAAALTRLLTTARSTRRRHDADADDRNRMLTPGLVAGLSDVELAYLAQEFESDEVIRAALRDSAGRAASSRAASGRAGTVSPDG